MRELQAAAARIAALGEHPPPPGYPPVCPPEAAGPEEAESLRQLQEATRRLTELRQRRPERVALEEKAMLAEEEWLEQSRISQVRMQQTLQAMLDLIPVKFDRPECHCDSKETTRTPG